MLLTWYRESTESLPLLRTPTVKWESPGSKSPISRLTDLPEIENLCDSMADVSKHLDGFGHLSTDEHFYAVIPLMENQKDKEAMNFVTLGDLIRKGRPLKLTRRQRFFIALTLCSSQLQLHKTPWLESGLQKDHILFAQSVDKKNLMLDRPYISRSFVDSSKLITPLTMPDATISNLGITLLELCFNTAFEELDTRTKYISADGQSNPYLDLAAALEWCNSEAAEEAGPDFADAIRWCLGQFGTSGARDESWRQELYQRVVIPLQNCHQQYEMSGSG